MDSLDYPAAVVMKTKKLRWIEVDWHHEMLSFYWKLSEDLDDLVDSDFDKGCNLKSV